MRLLNDKVLIYDINENIHNFIFETNIGHGNTIYTYYSKIKPEILEEAKSILIESMIEKKAKQTKILDIVMQMHVHPTSLQRSRTESLIMKKIQDYQKEERKKQQKQKKEAKRQEEEQEKLMIKIL